MADEKDKQEEIDETQIPDEEMPVEADQASAEREALINQLKEAEAKIVYFLPKGCRVKRRVI